MLAGELVLSARAAAALRWEGEGTVPRTRLPGFLKHTSLAEKRLRKRLIHFSLSSFFYDDDPPSEAWYCPACEKVYATFDLKKPERSI